MSLLLVGSFEHNAYFNYLYLQTYDTSIILLHSFNIKNIAMITFICSFYPVRVCAAGLCIWSRRFVYVCGQKTPCLRPYYLKISR